MHIIIQYIRSCIQAYISTHTVFNYAYIRTYIHIPSYMMHLYACKTRTCKRTCTHAYTQICTHRTYIYIHTYVHACIHTKIHTYIQYIYAVLEITVGHWLFSNQLQHLADQNLFWLAIFFNGITV